MYVLFFNFILFPYFQFFQKVTIGTYNIQSLKNERFPLMLLIMSLFDGADSNAYDEIGNKWLYGLMNTRISLFSGKKLLFVMSDLSWCEQVNYVLKSKCYLGTGKPRLLTTFQIHTNYRFFWRTLIASNYDMKFYTRAKGKCAYNYLISTTLASFIRHYKRLK
jgi:hypothetical protein